MSQPAPPKHWVILNVDGRAYGPFPPNHKEVNRLSRLKGVTQEYVPAPDKGVKSGK